MPPSPESSDDVEIPPVKDCCVMPGNGLRKFPISWSSTLYLPRSAFPARPIVADRAKYVKRCSDDLYAWQRNERPSHDTFTLHDGPPYANGDLHVGHALNKILKDITCRSQLSQGRRVDYIPGWDCHGLPIEQKALQQGDQNLWNTEGQTPSPIKIRELARSLAADTVEKQKASFKKWGVMADWDNAWKTMAKGFEIKQLEVFKKWVKQGLVYRRYKPVYWSPSSRTALAESELEYKDDHISTSAFIKFPVVTSSNSSLLGFGAISAVIWTTTPWTLPANRAIGVHKDLDYAVVTSQRHGNLLVASSRLGAVEKACKEDLPIVAKMKGTHLDGTIYEDTLFSPERRRFLLADFVTADSGSGLVHLAPGHGKEDYGLCLQYQIPAIAPVDDHGCFTRSALRNEPSLLEGKSVLGEGNDAVLALLQEHSLSIGARQFKHKYPYDWRSKQPVITRATSQWFADVGAVQKDALASLKEVRFIPETGRERLSSFVRNRSEWCISRQRAWGVPIPALYHRETGGPLMTDGSISHVTEIIRNRGINAWWTDAEDDAVWTPSAYRHRDGSSPYRRGKDTMDVWFDSGTSWTQAIKRDSEEAAPQVDIYLEGTDQHRGWFQSSLLTYVASQGDQASLRENKKAPFRTLITHGFTMDDKGQKMSKSIGNVVSPDQIMEGTLLPPLKRKGKNASARASAVTKASYDGMGPDALRLWVASSDFTKDVSLGQTVLKAINGSLSKYRVTFRLLLGMLQDYKPISLDIPFHKLGLNHQIVLMHLRQVRENVISHNKNFEYNKSVQEINNFINISLSAIYIETTKDTMYADLPSYDIRLAKAQAQYTFLHIVRVLQDMLTPITPIMIEEIWDYTPENIRNLSAHPLQRIVRPLADSANSEEGLWQNEQLQNRHLTILRQVDNMVKTLQEAVRSEKKMGSSLQSFVILQVGEDAKESTVSLILERYHEQLATLFVVSRVSLLIGDLPEIVKQAEWKRESKITVDGHIVRVHVYAPSDAKCVRCWRYAAPAESEPEEALCARCKDVIMELQNERPELFVEASKCSAAAVA